MKKPYRRKQQQKMIERRRARERTGHVDVRDALKRLGKLKETEK